MLLLLPHNIKIGWDLKFNTSTNVNCFLWNSIRCVCFIFVCFLFATFSIHRRMHTSYIVYYVRSESVLLFYTAVFLGEATRVAALPMMLMWYVNSGMLTYDENEMPKIVPFDFITPNYLQNVVVCVVMVYMLLYGKNDQGLLYEHICMDARVRAFLWVWAGRRTSICACMVHVFYIDTYSFLLSFSLFLFLHAEYKPFTLNR